MLEFFLAVLLFILLIRDSAGLASAGRLPLAIAAGVTRLGYGMGCVRSVKPVLVSGRGYCRGADGGGRDFRVARVAGRNARVGRGALGRAAPAASPSARLAG